MSVIRFCSYIVCFILWLSWRVDMGRPQTMVCVPCLILPFLLAIYLKFIQPYVLRLIPEAWRTTFDALLYPTCPVRPPVLEKTTSSETTTQLDNSSEQACCDQRVREKAD